MELDETFPIAQTEGRDLGDPDLYHSKAIDAVRFVKELVPTKVILVSDGDFGHHVETEMQKSLGKKRVNVLNGGKMKPQAIIASIRTIVARRR